MFLPAKDFPGALPIQNDHWHDLTSNVGKAQVHQRSSSQMEPKHESVFTWIVVTLLFPRIMGVIYKLGKIHF